MTLMWEIGVEDDRFNIHEFNEACIMSRCIELTNAEARLYFSLTYKIDSHVIDIIRKCENIK